MQAPTKARSTLRKKISYVLALACLAFVVYTFNGVRHAVYSEYGAINIHAAIVKFMEKEKRWPRSWSELEPHYKSFFLGLKSTHSIRQHYEIAWHIDPFELLKQETQNPPPDDALYSYTDNIVPVIYKIRKEKSITDSTTWILHPLTHRYLTSEQSNPTATLE